MYQHFHQQNIITGIASQAGIMNAGHQQTNTYHTAQPPAVTIITMYRRQQQQQYSERCRDGTAANAQAQWPPQNRTQSVMALQSVPPTPLHTASQNNGTVIKQVTVILVEQWVNTAIPSKWYRSVNRRIPASTNKRHQKCIMVNVYQSLQFNNVE